MYSNPYPTPSKRQRYSTRLQSRRTSFVPGSFSKMGSSSFRTARRSVARPSFASRVRAIGAYKHTVIPDSSITGALLFNNTYSSPLTTAIAQGTTNSTRIGDEVHLASLKLRGTFSTPATSGAYGYRVIVGFSTTQNNTFNNTAGVTVAQMFLPGSYNTLTMDGVIDPKAFTCLYDQTINCPSVVPLTSDAAFIEASIPLNQKFPYVSSGSVYGKLKNLYIVVIPYVANGTVFVTPCGSYAISADLCFQDM